MDKIKIGGIIAVIAVLILVISLGMPWYTFTEEDEDGETGTQRRSLDILPIYSHSERDISENQTTTMSITSAMATVGTGASVLSLLFIGIAIGSDNKKHAKIGAVLMVIGLIFAIIAPIYMMISYPDAILGDQYEGDEDNLPEDQDTPAESFFGSETSEGWEGQEVEESWGGGLGWFMSLIGGIILVISLILVALGAKSTPQRRPAIGAGMTQPRQQDQQWGQQQQEPQEQYPQEEEWTQEPQPRQMQEEQSQQVGWAQQSQQQQPTQQPRQQQVHPGPQQTQQESHTCPDCGQSIRYIEEYNSWYCDNCQEYK
ncbi:MAG: hypothetical protein ACOCSJ_00715 [Candidatus Natronoplasma sp.]